MQYPIHILSDEELSVLCKMFAIKKNEGYKELLEKKLSKVLLPAKGFVQVGLEYPEFLNRIAKKYDIDISGCSSNPERERMILVKQFVKDFNNFSEEEEKSYLAELQSNGLTNDQIASISGLATLGVAQMSGFGVYLLASSTVVAISSALGITLPFAFYTGMSQVISFAIGPVGFLIAALPIMYTYRDVRTWEEIRVRSREHYSNLKNSTNTLLKGNYVLGETAFKFLAGNRILKIQQVESEITSVSEDLESGEKIKVQLKMERDGIQAPIVELDIQKERKEEDVKNLELQLKNTIEEIDGLKKQKGIILDYIQEKDKQLNQAEQEITDVKNQLRALNTQKAQLQK